MAPWLASSQTGLPQNAATASRAAVNGDHREVIGVTSEGGDTATRETRELGNGSLNV